ncbi:MAG TPA: DUF1543 domain-containing protein [Chitinophagales bacterium]|nr:DUF1543 domain-containing protein [Chitinophagales bacterium]
MSESAQSNPEAELSLFAILLGCKPRGRNVEQHDVMFGVANKLDDLSDSIKAFWYKPLINELGQAVKKEMPDADTSVLEKNLLGALSRRDKVHIDAWTKVEHVDGYRVVVRPKQEGPADTALKLYFINLGGYKENEFEEFHKKLFVVATAVSEALEKVMGHRFMKEYSPESLGIAGGAHLDDQYKIDFDADDIVCISESIGDDFVLDLVKAEAHPVNEMNVGYTHINYPE